MGSFLVTGGAGFIGSHLVRRLLEEGESVRVLDDFSTGRRENLAGIESKIELIEGSVTDADIARRAVADMDVVFHEAAIPSVDRSVSEPVETSQVNVMGTVNLLEAARLAGVRRFVYAASSSAYGEAAVPVKDETLSPAPVSPYAAAKLTGEYMCAAFQRCFGLSTISLRYFNIFGARQDPASPYSAVIPLFITALLEGRSPRVFGDGKQSRDFTHIDNVVHANLLAARTERGAGEAVNVACGRSFSLLETLEELGRIIGVAPKVEFAPPRAGDVRHSLASIEKARELLGYEVVTPFEQGLEATVEYYKSLRY